MNFIRSQNTAKILWATLLSLMLISSFAASGMQVAPVKAVPLFTLHATETANPDWGYYGGYHSVWAAIMNACETIGIEVILNTYSDFGWYDRVWESGWNKSWSAADGWDMFIIEWWLQPHAVEPWFRSMIDGSLVPVPPVEPPFNVHPWRNNDADDLLHDGLYRFDAAQRQTYLRLWQEMVMEDPPMVALYYPKTYEIIGKWVSGYDPSGTWWYDTAELTLNNTMLATAKPGRDPNTLIYAVSEELWAMNPMFMDTYTDETASAIRFAELYKWSINNLSLAPDQMPDLDDYIIVPDMAADYPKYLQEIPGVSPNGTRVRVPLRQGMVWSNGQQINATDVKWTYDTMMDHVSKSTGVFDFEPIIKSVEIVDNHTVDFILYNPYPDILSVLANDWGTGSILPWHFFKDIPVGNLKGHPSNTWFSQPSTFIPASGPFQFRNGTDTVKPGTHVIYDRNPNYFGYNTSIVGSAWGPYNIDTIILSFIPDPAARMTAYLNYDADFGEYPIAPVQAFKDITDPYLRVIQYDYPSSNPVWYNFDNEYLSNRYIRWAIAHIIPYDYIINQLLPAWGIETAYRGKTLILPQHYYTDPNNVTKWLFHDTLSPFPEDAVKAQKYMDLWENSLVGVNITLNPYTPAGDADFSGKVSLDDFYIWRDNWGGSTPFSFLPGQDIDPDFNNDDNVAMYDFYAWRDHFGDTYP